MGIAGTTDETEQASLTAQHEGPAVNGLAETGPAPEALLRGSRVAADSVSPGQADRVLAAPILGRRRAASLAVGRQGGQTPVLDRTAHRKMIEALPLA